MSQVTRANSKLKFQTGDVPTQTDFEDLHDSVKWYDEGGGGITDGDKGDVVVSGTGAVWTLEDEFKRHIAENIHVALGSSIKGHPIYSIDRLSTTVALSDRILNMIPYWLGKGQTITGVKWWQATSGVYTANNYNGFGLYTYSAGTLTLVASSTDDGLIWKGTLNSWQSKAFSSTYSAAAGLYFIAPLYCYSAQTTAPTIGATSGLTSAQTVYDYTNSAKLFATHNSFQTTMPASFTMANTSSNNQQFYFSLY